MDQTLTQGTAVTSIATVGISPPLGSGHGSGRRSFIFSDSQRAILLKYFDEYGMTSTNRRNMDLMSRCAEEVGTTLDKVKNWIGSEAVKRKRKAGILPRPKFEFTGPGSAELKAFSPPPPKKIRRVNGYNLFFSEYIQQHPELGPDFKARNAVVAHKWAELAEEERKQWASRAEAVCSSSVQELSIQQQSPVSNLTGSQEPVILNVTGSSTPLLSEENLVEKTLLSIQEKFEVLEQLGFEGYAILVNTGALQTHLLATTKGKDYHKSKQQSGKPLENPFIGYVFSENSEMTPVPSSTANSGALSISPSLMSAPLQQPQVKAIRLSSNSANLSLSSLETMQRSVLNSFAVKYKVATGRSDVPYDALDTLGVQVYGMPAGVPFHSPLLYNQQQLQQILANLEKIVFLKVSSQAQQVVEVEIPADSVASLVDPSHGIQLTSDDTPHP